MKLIIEEAENGFIVEEDTEVFISGTKAPGKKHVFGGLADMQEFVKDFYTKRPNKNTPPRKKDKESP